MADFTANIKVQFELLGLGGQRGTGGSGGAGGSGAQPPSSGGTGGERLFASIEELRSEFSSLSSQVRAVAQGLEQIRTVANQISTGTQPTPRETPVGGTGASAAQANTASLEQAVEIINEAARSAQRAAESTKEVSAAQEDAAETSRRSSEARQAASQTESELSERARRDAEAAKAAAEEASGAFEKASNSLRDIGLNALNPERISSSLNLGGVFENVFQTISRDPGLRENAARAGAGIADLFRIDSNAPDTVRREFEVLQKNIDAEIKKAVSDISEGSTDARLASGLRSRINRLVSEFNEQRAPGGPRARSDIGAIAAQRVGARQFTALTDRIESSLTLLGRAVEEGADAITQSNLRGATEELVAQLITLTQRASSFNATFGTGRGGQEPFPRAPEARRSIREEIQVDPASITLNQRQRNALNALQRSIRNTSSTVFEASQQVFTQLTRGSGAFEDFETNLRDLTQVLSGPEANRITETRSELNKLFEVIRLLGRSGLDAQGGLRAPAGAVGPEASQAAAVNQFRRAQQSLFAQGRGVGSRTETQFSVQDSSGNVRRIRAELIRLGDTLDSVRVKARDVSDNMFDRTSVRAALQRVATWGAAAGIVFGALDAFRNALRTLVDTESAIVGLAKVMDESSVDFERFKDTAIDAATSIAQDFGQPLADVLETMILFGQQGKNLQESIELATAASLAATVTTLNQVDAASALTAVTAQFGLEFSEATSIVDKFNEVSNNAAVTETVLAQSIAKAGQAASNAGVSLDEFNGIVAAISEQTRQSGNEIGTALRFIFSRLQTPTAEQGLAQIGITARDASGEVRGFIPIIEDLARKFQDLSEAQRTQVAISIAGTRRFNTLLALLNNFSRFQESAANSANSAGSALREQARVADTAAFKIQQLRNSFSELSVSLGSALLGPIKVILDSFRSLVDIIADLPSQLTAAVAGITLAGAGLARFGDNFINSVGLAGAFRGLGKTFARSLTEGIAQEDLSDTLGAQFIPTQARRPGTLIARTVGDLSFDFRKDVNSIESLTSALARNNKVLVTAQGQVVKNSAAFSKFGAVVRGFRVADKTDDLARLGRAAETTSLGVLSLNSGLLRFLGSIGALTNRIPIISTAFSRLDQAAASLNSTLATGLVTIGRFAAVVAVVYAVVEGFKALRDIATRTGQDVAESLEPEIARRQETLNLINEQITANERLNRARADNIGLLVQGGQNVDLTPGPGGFSPTQAETIDRISRGTFRSPVVERQRAAEQRQQLAQQVAVATPEAISSFDDLGNAILESSDALDQFAKSAASAQSNLLALSQVKAIEALSSEFESPGGLRGALRLVLDFNDSLASLGDSIGIPGLGPDSSLRSDASRFNTTIGTLNKNLERTRELREELNVQAFSDLGLSIQEIDPEGAERLNEQLLNTLESSSRAELGIKAIGDALRNLPVDSIDLSFDALPREGAFREQLEAAAGFRTQQTGVQTTPGDILRQLRLQASATIREAGPRAVSAIGTSAEETLGRFRESGIIGEFLSLREDIEEQVQSFSGGEVILFPGVKGFPDQALVEIGNTGERIVKLIDENGRQAVRPLQEVLEDIFNQGVSAVRIDPSKLIEEVNATFREIGRVATGAARGSILQQDIDLGAAFSFDVSAQQRVAFRDELLVAGVQDAEAAVKRELDSIGAAFESTAENANTELNLQNVQNFLSQLRELDRSKVVLNIATQFEEAARSFEKAVDDIDRANLSSRIEAEFSGFFGARRGILNRRFEQPQTREDLSAEQFFDSLNAPLVQFANTISETEKALGEFISSTLQADADAETLVRDFVAAGERGGVSDPQRLSVTATAAAARVREGVGRAQSQILAQQELQVSEQVETNRLLRIIADREVDDRVLGTVLAEAISDATSPDTRQAVVDRLRGAGSEEISRFSPRDLERLQASIGAGTVEALDRAVIESRATTSSRDLFRLVSELDRDSERGAGPGVVEAVRNELAPFLPSARAGAETIQTSEFLEAQQRNVSTIVGRVLERSSGNLSDVAIEEADVRDLIRGQAEAIREVLNNNLRLGTDENIGPILTTTLDRLERALESGDEEVFNLFRRELTSLFRESTRPPRRPGQEEAPPAEQTALERARAFTPAAVETLRGIAELQEPFRQIVANAELLGVSLSELRQNFAETFNRLIDDIEVGRRTVGLSGATGGTFAGLSVPDIGIAGLREDLRDLSSEQLTTLESPELSRGIGETNRLFQGTVSLLELTARREQDIARQRERALAAGDLDGVSRATRALQQLGDVSSSLESRALQARQELGELQESFARLSRINELRQNLNNLFDDLRIQQNLVFDRTSIETALGRGPFAATRPSFEQFEQGQAGDLTAFERSLEDLNAQFRLGAISAEEFRRGQRRARFERDESLIGFAQQRETGQFESQVRTAEQVREQLLRFSLGGGPGADVARGLADQLGTELEQAGDIIRGGFGPETIRDPRTGQEVTIPASDVRRFRGVPGLEDAIRQFEQFSQEAAERESARQAELINRPIVNELQGVRGILERIEDITAEASEVEGIEDMQAISEGLGTFATAVPDLIRVQEELKDALASGDQAEFRQALQNFKSAVDRLQTIPEETRAAVLESAAVVTEGGGQFSAEGLVNFIGFLGSINEEADPAFAKLIGGLTEAGEGVFALGRAAKPLVDSFRAVDRVLSSLSVVGGGESRRAQNKASGGLIVGPGGPRDDRIPINASAGEFVLRASAVKNIGVDTLNQLNSSGGRIGPDRSTKQTFGSFQDGGEVSASDLKAQESFDSALIALEGQLRQRRQEFVKRFDFNVSQVGNDLNTASRVLAGETDFGASDERELADRLVARAEGISNLVKPHEGTNVFPLLEKRPPRGDVVNKGILFRAVGEGAVGLGINGLSGEFFPQIFGPALETTPLLEKSIEAVLQGNVVDKLVSASQQVRFASTFAGSALQSKNIIDHAVQEVDNILISLEEKGVSTRTGLAGDLRSAADFASFASTTAKGVVGNVGGVVAGEQTVAEFAKRTVEDALFSPARLVEEAVSAVPERAREIDELRSSLSSVEDSQARRQIRQQIINLERENTNLALGAGLQVAGGVVGARGLGRLPTGAINRNIRIPQISGLRRRQVGGSDSFSRGQLPSAATRELLEDARLTSVDEFASVRPEFSRRVDELLAGQDELRAAQAQRTIGRRFSATSIQDPDLTLRELRRGSGTTALSGRSSLAPGIGQRALGRVNALRRNRALARQLRGAPDLGVRGEAPLRRASEPRRGLEFPDESRPVFPPDNPDFRTTVRLSPAEQAALPDIRRQPSAPVSDRPGLVPEDPQVIRDRQTRFLESDAIADFFDLPRDVVRRIPIREASLQRFFKGEGLVDLGADLADQVQRLTTPRGEFIRGRVSGESVSPSGVPRSSALENRFNQVAPPARGVVGEIDGSLPFNRTDLDVGRARTQLDIESGSRRLAEQFGLPEEFVGSVPIRENVLADFLEGRLSSRESLLLQRDLFDEFERVSTSRGQFINRRVSGESISPSGVARRSEFSPISPAARGISSDVGSVSDLRAPRFRDFVEGRISAEELLADSSFGAGRRFDNILRANPFLDEADSVFSQIIEDRPSTEAILQQLQQGNLSNSVGNFTGTRPGTPGALGLTNEGGSSVLGSRRLRAFLAALLDDFEPFQTGGRISGPGTSRSDSIPILVSNGEYIINSAAAAQLGLPVLEALNRGQLPKFQDGGLVGSSGSSGSLEVNIDTDAIASAISNAITEAIDQASVNIDTGNAASEISQAITGAFNTLNLGDSVGAAVRSRLEAVEGSVSSLREDTNTLLDSIGDMNISSEVSSLADRTETISNDLFGLEQRINNQEQKILDRLDFKLNQELSNDNIENRVTARIDRVVAQFQQDLTSLEGQVKSAIRSADMAMAKALSR